MKKLLAVLAAISMIFIGMFSCTLPVDDGGTTAPEINVKLGAVDLPSGSGNHDFGSVLMDGSGVTASADVVFTIENLGDADLVISGISVTGDDFSAGGTAPVTVAAAGSTTFTVRFDPLAVGSCSGTVTISSNDADEGSYTFTVSGTGTAVAEPEIEVLQGSTPIPSGTGTYAFGSFAADGPDGAASSDVVFTIHNAGTVDLTLSSVTKDGDDFDLTGPTATAIAPDGSVTFSVRFDPVTVGSRSATVTIANNDSDEGTYTFTVTGTGTASAPDINVQHNSTDVPIGSSVNFGAVLVDGGVSSTLYFSIQNLGTGTLSLTSVTVSGSEFEITQLPFSTTILPGASEQFAMRFNPSAPGSRSETLTIVSNDPDEGTYTFAVIGSGQAPEINVTQGSSNLPSGSGSYDFGGKYMDGDGGEASAYMPFTINNLGTSNLTISSVNVSGTDFDITSVSLAPITPGSSTTFKVRFDPLVLGTCTATVTIANNDADEGTYTFTVTGTGTDVVPPEINVRQGSTPMECVIGYYSFGYVDMDGDGGVASAYVPFTIENLGSADLVISSVTVSGNDFDWTQPESMTVGPGLSTTFTIRFDPRVLGSRTATVTIINNDSDESTYTFGLAGTGGVPDINVRQGATQIPDDGIYSFGSVSADGNNGAASDVVTFTVENLGTYTLYVNSQGFYGQFTHFDYALPSLGYIAPGASVTFTVRFDPLTAGSWSCYLIIGSTDPDEGSYTINFEGTGT